MAFATLCFLCVQGTATYLEFEKLDEILKKVKEEDKQRVRDLILVKDNILNLESGMKNASKMAKEVDAFDNNLNDLRTNIASVKTTLENLGYRQKRRVKPEDEVNANDWYLEWLARTKENYEILDSEKDSLIERLTDINEKFLSKLATLIGTYRRIDKIVAGFNPSQKRASAEGSASLNRLRQDDVTPGAMDGCGGAWHYQVDGLWKRNPPDLTNIIRNSILKMDAIIDDETMTKIVVEAALTDFDERSGEYESALKSIGTELEGVENIVEHEKTRRGAPAT